MKVYKITGKVVSSDTNKGIKGLRVEAWDKDLFINDMVGSAITSEGGVFRIQFDESYFKELFLDRRPDLFFKVFKGSKLIKSTEDSILWNVENEDIEQIIEVTEVNDMSTPKNNPIFVKQQGSELFKFITIRPFQRQKEAEVEKKKVLCYRPVDNASQDLHWKLLNAKNNPPEGSGPREAMIAVAQEFVETDESFVRDIHDLWNPQQAPRSSQYTGNKSSLGILEEWIFNRKKPIAYDDLQLEIKTVYNSTDIGRILQHPEYHEDIARLQDSIMTLSIVPSFPHKHRDRLVNALRICRIIERMAQLEKNPDANDALKQSYGIENAMKAPVVLPTDIFPLPPAKRAEAKLPSDQKSEHEEELQRLREEQAALRTAIEELEHLSPADYVKTPKPSAEAQPVLKKEEIDKLSDSTRALSKEIGLDLANESISEVLNKLETERRKSKEAKATEIKSAIDEMLQLSISHAPKHTELSATEKGWEPWTLTQEAIGCLSATTVQTIQEIGCDLTRDSVPHVKNILEEELANVVGRLFVPPRRKMIIRRGESRFEFLPSIEIHPGLPGELDLGQIPELQCRVMPVGMGEYNSVRQTLLRYEDGEVAHIENVLRGEYKERVHRRLRRLEEELTYAEEQKTTTEKDLQSTDRFELKREASETIKEEHKADAGVTVKYDTPMVDVEAKAGYSYDHAKEHAKKTSVSYARDVTQKSLSRLEEKVREVRVAKTIEEFEETNTHGFDNKGQQNNAIGIYRWVDKIYEAQVINYGNRLFFDFVIPEPAAFYIYALTHSATTDLKEPVPPTVCDENGFPCSDPNKKTHQLQPSDIKPDNYMAWVSIYNVAGVIPPPPMDLTKGYAFSKETQISEDNEGKGTSIIDRQVIPIPENYRAWGCYVDIWPAPYAGAYLSLAGQEIKLFDPSVCPVMYEHANYEGDKFPLYYQKVPHLSSYGWNDKVSSIKFPHAGWSVLFSEDTDFKGDKILITKDEPHLSSYKWNDKASSYELFPPRSFHHEFVSFAIYNYIGKSSDLDGIPLTVAFEGEDKYTINLNVLYRRTDEALKRWQLDTYDAIMQAYYKQKADYEEKLAAAAIQEGVSISGRNPGQNQEIIETELKKWALSMLTGQDFTDFNAMQRDSWGEYPGINYSEAKAEGSLIQFFEQAFEWPLMNYLFYPYFWGKRKSSWDGGPTWINKITGIQDVDPLFEKFLKAGAARITVPVRPGFEDAIHNYVSTGKIWNGGQPPTIDDPLYVSIVEEIQQLQGAYVEKSEGTISVEHGSDQVVGTNTKFEESDAEHEIYIERKRYVIAEVQNTEHLTLTEPYDGETIEYARYYIGVKLIGGPWQVRVPTSLVHLQEDMTLPDFQE